MSSRLPRAGLQLNLSKELIEKNAYEIGIKVAEERRVAKQKLDEDCAQAFQISAHLVMNSKESINGRDIKLSSPISKCSQFEEFKKMMSGVGIKVHDSHSSLNKVVYQVDGKRRELFFY